MFEKPCLISFRTAKLDLRQSFVRIIRRFPAIRSPVILLSFDLPSVSVFGKIQVTCGLSLLLTRRRT